MALLTRQQVLDADDRSRKETVEVPEWGGSVIVGVLGGDERDRFELYREQCKKKGANSDGYRALLVAMACEDEEGNRLFRPEDVDALGKKSAFALDKVFNEALRVSGLGEQATENSIKNS